jgi:signal transduction histidine kinase
LTVLFLGGTVLLVILLALQAHAAWIYQRTTAEGVLRDYSRLVAEEFIRRASQEIGYRGFYCIVTAMQQHEELLPQAGGDGCPTPDLARTRFVVDPAAGSIETAGAPIDRGDAERLIEGIRATVASGRASAGPLFGVASGPRLVVAAGSAPRVVGFEVDRAALAQWLERLVDARPLLPRALGDGELTNDLLYLRLTDTGGATIYARGESPDPRLATHTPLADAYGGVFGGLSLETSIEPAAAARLVIGGLPRSRLPLLAGVLLLTLGLLGAAVWLLRRERALARMRSDFVARVSHELRTPLTQIRLFAETLLLGRTRTDEEHRRSLEIIDQEARRLGHLVENILQFSRGERAATRLAPRRLELGRVVRDQAEKFAPVARARDVRITTELGDGATVLADEEALRQVLLNLVDNAVKYGPPGQEVRIGLERAERTARVFVEDEGPGVPERDRERIWAAWQRLARDERRAIAGTGIGLTVVRDLVRLHGGRAWVEGGRRGGARFVVELPVIAGDPA